MQGTTMVSACTRELLRIARVASSEHIPFRKRCLHIADSDKQVYTPEADPFSADDFIRIKKVSIRNASIFHGFCEAHDSELFQPIEVDSIQLNREHACLLAYRALSLELYAKRKINEIDLSKKLTGDVQDPINLQIANVIEYQQLGASIAIEDMATHAKMKQAFLTNDFSDTYFYAIRFNRIPDILSSGGISPIATSVETVSKT